MVVGLAAIIVSVVIIIAFVAVLVAIPVVGIAAIAVIVVGIVLLLFGRLAENKEEKALASLSMQDLKFLKWVSEISTSERSHLMPSTEAMRRADFADAERHEGMLYDDANKALNEVDQFSVSPKVQPSKDEFKLAQQDLKQVGYYAKTGTRKEDPDDIGTAIEYGESCINHLFRSHDLLPKYPLSWLFALPLLILESIDAYNETVRMQARESVTSLALDLISPLAEMKKMRR